MPFAAAAFRRTTSPNRSSGFAAEVRLEMQERLPVRKAALACGTVLLALALLALLLLLRPKAPIAATESAKDSPAPVAHATNWSSTSAATNDTSPPPATPDAPSPKPVIDAAYLEKTEVCRGEQNFVNVEAHTENGTDAYLNYLVKDPETGQLERGTRVAFSQQRSSDEPIQIFVQGPSGDQTIEIPPPTVKDCDEPVQLQVELTRSFDTPDRVELTAKLLTGGASAGGFTAHEYVWEFDDGTSVTETSGHVEHSYENRVQSARTSSFVVNVTARERGGRSASGARTVTLSNFGFLSAAFEDKVNVFVGTQRDPQPGRAGDRLWLYHAYDRPVRLTRVHMREIEIDHSAGGGREVERADYSAAQALGFSELRPRQSMDVVGLAKLTPTRAGTVRFYEVEGRSDDGKVAHASFVLSSPLAPLADSTAHVDLGVFDDDTSREAL
jgi:hypothetical protein